MNPIDYIAFISNGKELSLAGVKDVVDLESHDQVIQADECNCTHKEHIASCEIVNVAVDVEDSRKQIKRYVVEMAFCKECAVYYLLMRVKIIDLRLYRLETNSMKNG